jgi:hypothetical protein
LRLSGHIPLIQCDRQGQGLYRRAKLEACVPDAGTQLFVEL